MQLSEFFQLIQHSEISRFIQGDPQRSTIYPDHADEVVAHIQLGLTDLHTRFPLRLSELILRPREGKFFYTLTKKFAYSSGSDSEHYIDDRDDVPFGDNIIQIDAVYDSMGRNLPLNDHRFANSIFTPEYNILQLPTEFTQHAGLSVVYRADHPTIHLKTMPVSDIELLIPPSFIQALLIFVQARLLFGFATPESNQEAVLLLQRYEQALLQIHTAGIVQTDALARNTLEANGWA